MQLEHIGWNSHFAEPLSSLGRPDLSPARVSREERTGYQIITPLGERFAQITGQLRHDARDRLELPTVGDWVGARIPENNGDQATIDVLLPRRGCLVRKSAGQTTTVQVIAANIDVLFLVMGLDGDFSVHRLERYLTITYESGAQPVVLLNKADLCDDVDEKVAEIQLAAIGVPVHTLIASEGTGIDEVRQYFADGQTVALVGSSGVGKSTVINAILGEERLKVGEVMNEDGRGRHTTTWRHLVPIPGGGVLIDTPGMRELQLWAGEESLDYSFSDIAALAENCRFNDCKHLQEPGCAVRQAVDDDGLDAARLESFHKLQRELRFLASKQDHLLRIAERNRWKAIHKAARALYKKR